jgi:hypothetical protein
MSRTVYRTEDYCSWCMGDRCYKLHGKWICFDCGNNTIKPIYLKRIGYLRGDQLKERAS